MRASSEDTASMEDGREPLAPQSRLTAIEQPTTADAELARALRDARAALAAMTEPPGAFAALADVLDKLPRDLQNARWAAFDVSEQLLRVLSGALDIREVFPQVSAVARAILPHERLTMSFHDGLGTCVLHAVSNDDGPLVARVKKRIDAIFDGSFKIIDDLTLDKPDAV